MESDFQRYAAGYVKMSVAGEGVERFLNLCSVRGILPFEIYKDNSGVCFCMLVEDYRLIRPLVRKTGIKVRLLEKRGLPFFVYKYRNRTLLLIGIATAIFFLFILSQRIWSIRIDGNLYYSDDTLLDYLKTENIKCGIKKKQIVCDDVEALLRIRFDSITWASVQIEGTLLNISIKENIAKESLENKTYEPCDIVSEYNGRVASIITRNGTPMVKEGDDVTEGQVLISGVIDMHDDSDTLTGHTYTVADGDVYITTTIDIDKVIDRSFDVRNTVKNNRGLFIKLGSYEETFMLPVSSRYPFEKQVDISQMKIFDNFYLPIFIGRVSVDYYDTYIDFYDTESFKEYCEQILEEEMRNLEKKGVEIIQNNVIISSDDFYGYLKGYFTVKLRTGIQSGISLPEDNPTNESQ